MPTILLGHFVYRGTSVEIGRDIEDDGYCVHVRIFGEPFGTAIVATGIDGIEETYNLWIPPSRVRQPSERVFNLRPVHIADRRPQIGALLRALRLPTLVLNLSDEEPVGGVEVQSQDGFCVAPPTAHDASQEPTRLLDPAVQLLRDQGQLAALLPSVALAAARAAVAHARVRHWIASSRRAVEVQPVACRRDPSPAALGLCRPRPHAGTEYGSGRGMLHSSGGLSTAVLKQCLQLLTGDVLKKWSKRRSADSSDGADSGGSGHHPWRTVAVPLRRVRQRKVMLKTGDGQKHTREKYRAHSLLQAAARLGSA